MGKKKSNQIEWPFFLPFGRADVKTNPAPVSFENFYMTDIVRCHSRKKAGMT
jgi:hypothetical protein